jgi:putative ABC transport system permease protein
MASQYWPNQNPIGKEFDWGGRHITVIGIVGDIHVQALDKPVGPTIYNSAFQIESGASISAVFILRTGQDAARLASSAQNAIWSVDKGLPMLGFSTLDQVVSASLAIRRISLALVGAFAFIALLLAVVGIYGVLSYAVAQRVQEMGLRQALGAKPSEIARLVMGEGMRLTATGILLGLAGSAVAARFISNLLFGIESLDPLAFTAGALLLLAVSLAAIYPPARRASRVDPMVALKYE